MSTLGDQASTCHPTASSPCAGHASPNRASSPAQRRLQADIRARLNVITGPAPSLEERALLSRMLTTFPAKTLAAVDQLARDLHAPEINTIQARAHALKGSATNLGVTDLADLFTTIEDQARHGQLPDSASSTLLALHDALNLATAACTTIAAEITSPASTTPARSAE